MKHLAAYMLAVLCGNNSPKAADIESILSSVGIAADADKLKVLLEQVGGKDLDSLIADGSAKFGAVGGVATGGAAASKDDVKEEAAAEEEEEESEESEADMGFSLFD